MITDDLLMYMLFQLILFVFNIIGFKKIPFLMILTLISGVIIAYPTSVAFADYDEFGLILIIINLMFPLIGLILKLAPEH